ncbi:spore coat protein [Paenibacillus polymyxa]|uniref:Coat F domain-containing protein n=1 Tax=Paenibacillus polymyxa TaxID=1406 RepID=A0A378XWW1_PAEPO|nr:MULTISPECIES: spore coat protein [Paenibacillus]KAF6582293.1 spore coat protein [Paenibacillus sp. EKM211P]KJD40994.1 coat protein F [Paenibacillus polymyxa]KKD55741.1 coat protein F [Paenibacillus sp. ICGEB2008]MBE3648510.1 spore coat protein [Paenibacillus polymyxa]MBE7897229.1 spore coat protein [Paenibacillus polymyxa]
MYSQNNMSFMPEEDLLYSILADMKRTVREYTTATTESNCPSVRQMFTDLTNDTLRMQGDLYHLMSQNNMYAAPTKALRIDLDKQIQEARKTQQECQQFIQQKSSSARAYGQPMHQGQSTHQSNPYYM